MLYSVIKKRRYEDMVSPCKFVDHCDSYCSQVFNRSAVQPRTAGGHTTICHYGKVSINCAKCMSSKVIVVLKNLKSIFFRFLTACALFSLADIGFNLWKLRLLGSNSQTSWGRDAVRPYARKRYDICLVRALTHGNSVSHGNCAWQLWVWPYLEYRGCRPPDRPLMV